MFSQKWCLSWFFPRFIRDCVYSQNMGELKTAIFFANFCYLSAGLQALIVGGSRVEWGSHFLFDNGGDDVYGPRRLCGMLYRPLAPSCSWWRVFDSLGVLGVFEALGLFRGVATLRAVAGAVVGAVAGAVLQHWRKAVKSNEDFHRGAGNVNTDVMMLWIRRPLFARWTDRENNKAWDIVLLIFCRFFRSSLFSSLIDLTSSLSSWVSSLTDLTYWCSELIVFTRSIISCADKVSEAGSLIVCASSATSLLGPTNVSALLASRFLSAFWMYIHHVYFSCPWGPQTGAEKWVIRSFL